MHSNHGGNLSNKVQLPLFHPSRPDAGKHEKALKLHRFHPPKLIFQIPSYNSMSLDLADPPILQVFITFNQQVKDPLYFIQLLCLPLLPLRRLQLSPVITEIRIEPASQLQRPFTSHFLDGVDKVVLDAVSHAAAVQELDVRAKLLFQSEHLPNIDFLRFHVGQEWEPAETRSGEDYYARTGICFE